MFLRFGRSGYTRIMRYALDHAIYLRDRLIRTGKFQIMNHTQRISRCGAHHRQID